MVLQWYYNGITMILLSQRDGCEGWKVKFWQKNEVAEYKKTSRDFRPCL